MRALRQLVRLGLSVEKKFNTYQDIEWAIKDDTIILLQTSPITTT
ncbi:hypothetical protein GF357_00310 [Candidatus Dojkabacteria bacterium]|nr:hypothetical protein [Candidatus Dojkabacteria bacterium]